MSFSVTLGHQDTIVAKGDSGLHYGFLTKSNSDLESDLGYLKVIVT